MEDFKHALETNCLFDLGWQGTKYTWSNGHTDNTFIKLRLDRAVASKEWIEKLGQKKVEVLTSARSNDQPILISSKLINLLKCDVLDFSDLKPNGSNTVKKKR